METKRKPNWSLEKNVLLTVEVHQRKHIIQREIQWHIDGSRQKEIENKINASYTLVAYTLWNTKKCFTILSEGCQEIAAYKKAAAATGKL